MPKAHALARGGKSRFRNVHVVHIVLCIYDMYALLLLQRSKLFAESYSFQRATPCVPLVASARSRPRARRTARRTAFRSDRGPDQVRTVMLPHRRVGRLNANSPRRVLQQRLFLATFREGHQCPLGGPACSISRPIPSVDPVSPALRDEPGGPISEEPTPWNIFVRRQAGIPECWELVPAESYSPQRATPGTPASRHAWGQNFSHEKTDELYHAGRPCLPLIPGGGK